MKDQQQARHADPRPLSLDEIFKLVVTRKTGEGKR